MDVNKKSMAKHTNNHDSVCFTPLYVCVWKSHLTDSVLFFTKLAMV